MRAINKIDPAAADNDNQFVMLGTIHRDTGGRETLAGWLDEISPDVITLEFSSYGLQFREINGDRLRKKLCDAIKDMGLEPTDQGGGPFESLFSYLDPPYEFTAVADYARKTDIPFHLVDVDLFSSLKLREAERMMDRENLDALLHPAVDSAPGTVREKVLAELFFWRGIKTYRYTDEMGIRDHVMKNRISLLMRHHGPGRFLHVCGWQHLPDPRDIYSLLKPIKVFMYDRTFRI